MNAKLAEQFAQIAKETISMVDLTECFLDDYIEGLRLIVGELNVAIVAGEEDAETAKAVKSIFSVDPEKQETD